MKEPQTIDAITLRLIETLRVIQRDKTMSPDEFEAWVRNEFGLSKITKTKEES